MVIVFDFIHLIAAAVVIAIVTVAAWKGKSDGRDE